MQSEQEVETHSLPFNVQYKLKFTLAMAGTFPKSPKNT
jgi:hypothetical protein